MRVRRGLMRESCDFCHRRKIKCDRESRRRQGLNSCSQCSLRHVDCRIDNSDDIRLHRKNQADIKRVPSSPNRLATASSLRALSCPQEASTLIPSPTTLISVDATDNSDPFNVNDPFQLSEENITFLDSIFLGDDFWSAQMEHMDPLQPESFGLPILPEAEPRIEEYGNDAPTLAEADPLWDLCNTDKVTFEGALVAYFEFGGSHLPVLSATSFWDDYNAGHCSRCLVLAVACRGFPFIQVNNKWAVQQQVAMQFRKMFLDAQAAAGPNRHLPLDVVEALALMVGFPYQEEGGLSSQLGSLFLTHDALVLLTLAYCPDTEEATAEAIADRRSLLFWHVYGIDAFHCLDKKTSSRLPDAGLELPRTLVSHEPRGYLDAILDLALFVRGALPALCGPVAKRKGIRRQDLLDLYQKLEQWRQQRCPTIFRQESGNGNGNGSDKVGESVQLQLHRMVLCFLEINIYMQMESCVMEFGVREEGLEAEAVLLRVGSESVQASHNAIELVTSSMQVRMRGKGGTSFSLVDLAPSILRDCCSGLCLWMCNRARQRAFQTPVQQGRKTHRQQQHMNIYKKHAEVFREAVATATSHADTSSILTFLDEQLTLLDEEIDAVTSNE